ncbi:LysM peptidoglycan-binding domain-containing protein [Acinetobacter qingfengensis]|uniref:Lytic transglycosylase n=1 Tax=Acinetobacter qingfengensis TaxID=1262585 RepID=A0A1E7R8A2_9GAMM|nr:LysM peptidoglycan-binding domain-containing protein [Acinetobacter qingfengensis]KAA8731422.1 LysM peptidoglycan-binding domain-containing protein [Acinetobacter qingfengensis]OEY95517.1 lytic transglycosylase [Acinetobacter qingfengensis]
MLKVTALAWQNVVNQTFKLSILTTALASIAVLSGCSTTQQNSQVSKSKNDLLDADSLNSLEDLLYATDMRAVESDRLLVLRYGDVWRRMTVGFKMNLSVYDPRIEAQRGWFISRQPYLDRLSARASRYLYYTVKEAERRGIPTELALLPVIESSYDPAATSSASAAGLWQFIPSTGRIYGLRQSDLYDGRRDVVESTRAAYEYLSSLYNQFGSWELALASYNAGPGRIQQAINRNKAAGLPTDYWSLKLPTETMNYVPRFLAVAQIIKTPERYGVHLPAIANRPHFREVAIPGSIDLNELSGLIGVSRGELYALNPAHRGNYTDPMAPGRILIPNEVNAAMDSKIARMKTMSGSGGLWAGTAAPPPVLTTSPSTARPVTSVSAQSATSVAVSRSQPTPQQTVVVNNTTKRTTPQGSQALAAFAANADVPSAPRLPVSITPARNVQQINIEPPISDAEKQVIIAQDDAKNAANIKTSQQENAAVARIVEPKPSDAERQQVIRELEQIAPKGTEIVDPLDGKIKLTAIQSSQSIADQKGEEVKLNYAYPKAVADAENRAHSEAIARNAGKPIVETQNEVVVVAPKGQRQVYTVQSGDTLLIVAQKYGLNWRDIAVWNQINPDNPLFVGTRLYLYNAKPLVSTNSPSAPAIKRPDRYTVKAGDSLTAIAQQFDVSLQDLAAWNNLAPTSNVRIGQRLTLNEPKNFKSANAGSSSISNTNRNTVATETYTVKRGEYLQMLAARYDMSINDLLTLNPDLNINSNLLVGQKIKVPKTQLKNTVASSNESSPSTTPKIKTMTYTVVAGDYLSSVATKYNISLSDLAALNNINLNTPIMVGQRLQVPATEQRPESYVAQNGDTLSSIARKFDLSVTELASYNYLKTTARVNRGMILKLQPQSKNTSTVAKKTEQKYDQPVTSQYKGDTETYVVQAGESLTALANRYQLSITDLAALNKLKSNTSLRVGQKIKVPKRTTSYKVKAGDNLTKLAQRYNVSLQQLAEMNDLQPTTQVRIGQVLTVPNSN